MRLRGLPALLACVLVLCAPMSAAAQDRVADGQRLLAYHGYLQRERARRIDQLAAELQVLASVEVRIEAEQVALEVARTAQQSRLDALERDRTARTGTLAQLESRYRDRAAREKAPFGAMIVGAVVRHDDLEAEQPRDWCEQPGADGVDVD